VVASSLEARQIAETWLYTLWAERTTYSTMLSPKYAWLDPTDTVTIDLDSGDSYTLRIETTDFGADWTTKVGLASEDLTTYQVSTVPAIQQGGSAQVLQAAPFMDFFLFNTPLLQDSDDLGGASGRIYYAGGASQTLTGSPSAFVYKSPDGSAWPQFATMVGFANWGRALTTLGGTNSVFTTDYINSFTVMLTPGSVAYASCTYTDLMNGVNPILVGNEILQAQQIDTNADGSTTFSILARGRRGTEWACNSHQVGEIVILLQPGQIGANQLTLGEIGVDEFWKLVPQGRTLVQVPTESFTYLAYDLFPYAPVQLARTTSGSDLVLSWLRRTRIGGLMQDGTDNVPLSEESEAYEAYILAVPRPHRYWRLSGMNTQYFTIDLGNVSGGVAIAELQVRSSPGGANLSFLAAGITASSGAGPSNAIDGNTATYWAADPSDSTASLALDFGSGNAYALTDITIVARFDAQLQGPTSFNVDWSDDGSTWTTLVQFTPASWVSSVTQTFDIPTAVQAAFTPTNTATYVRAFTGLTAPTVTYTAAMMTADNFTPATETLYLSVYQISGVIGRGFQGYAALPPF
jgi:hypothetical protein